MSNQVLSTIIDMTPPIRRVTIDPSSFDYSNSNLTHSSISLKRIPKNSLNFLQQSEEKNNNNQPETILRERSISTISSLSNNDSLGSFYSTPSVHQDDNDDDASSNDEINQQWNSNQLPLHLSNRQLMFHDSLSITGHNDEQIAITITMSECEICLEEYSIEPLSCCSSLICSKCLSIHLSTNISEHRIRICCPSCSHIWSREEILLFLSSSSSSNDNSNLAERYKRFYANMNNNIHMKTCPRCCSLKEIDQTLFEHRNWKRTIPRQVRCHECQFQWCFLCHAPWHKNMSCKQFQQGEKMLQLWATQINQNQQPNAQKCPRCKIYISRNGGCPHMICSKCQCDFCYNCGKRRLTCKFFGSHESRYSPLGCKYNFYPKQPILRHTIRGLIAGIATLAIPIAAVGAVAILAVGTTIAAPSYGTYRLIKHIRFKRYERHRRHQMESLSTYHNGIDEHHLEIEKAIQASLITFKDEITKRSYSDDDDDSLDE